MNCQRCGEGEAKYRVFSDLISLFVCYRCVLAAEELGLAVESKKTRAGVPAE